MTHFNAFSSNTPYATQTVDGTSHNTPNKETIIRRGFSIPDSNKLRSLKSLVQSDVNSFSAKGKKTAKNLSKLETKLSTLSQAIKKANSDLETQHRVLSSFKTIDSIELDKVQRKEIEGLIKDINKYIAKYDQALQPKNIDSKYQDTFKTLRQNMRNLSSELDIIQGKMTITSESKDNYARPSASNSFKAGDICEAICCCLYGTLEALNCIGQTLWCITATTGKGAGACLSGLDGLNC